MRRARPCVSAIEDSTKTKRWTISISVVMMSAPEVSDDIIGTVTLG